MALKKYKPTSPGRRFMKRWRLQEIVEAAK